MKCHVSRLRMRLGRKTIKNGLIHTPDTITGLTNLFDRRNSRMPWIAIHPGILAQRHSLINERFKSRIVSQARLTGLLQAVSAAKWLIMVRKKRLEGLLNNLLAMKERIF